MVEKRSAILELHQQGMKQCEIVERLKVPKQMVSYTINRFKELGHDGDRPGRGRNRTVNTARNRAVIKKRVKKVAREMKFNRETARLMARVELGLYPYKMKEAQKLTAENKTSKV